MGISFSHINSRFRIHDEPTIHVRKYTLKIFYNFSKNGCFPIA